MRIHSQKGHHSQTIQILLRTNLPVLSRVSVGTGAADDVDRVLAQCEVGKRVALLCQQPVRQSVAEPMLKKLSDSGYQCQLIELEDGEACKAPESLVSIWTKLQEMQFERADCIVAVGGGALTDVAGFAASTYLRGVRLVLVPTTLLAQVDASIGGKTGINLASGKNLAGSFYFPSAVIVDPDTLDGLSERQMRSGLGEIVKYALIETTVAQETDYRQGPRSLLSLLQDGLKNGNLIDDFDSLVGIITACVKMKLAVVAKDPHEGRLRRCLNLGHTLGHAIEKVSSYGVTHGEAVGIGLVFACRIAERMGRLDVSQTEELVALLNSANLPTSTPAELDRQALVNAMAFDKKRVGGAVKFVLPTGGKLGEVDLDVAVTTDDLNNKWKELV